MVSAGTLGPGRGQRLGSSVEEWEVTWIHSLPSLSSAPVQIAELRALRAQYLQEFKGRGNAFQEWSLNNHALKYLRDSNETRGVPDGLRGPDAT